MGKIIAVVNQKGGVGKTTSAVNLTAALSALGLKVLLCDFDPQANATSGLGFDINTQGIYECITGECKAEDVMLKSEDVKNLWVLPSSINLVAADTELPAMENAHHIIKGIVESVREKYDYIFIDCSPSLGLITVNALTAADSVIIPVQCEYFALEGIGKLLNTIKIIKSGLNPALNIEGFLLTMFDARLRYANQVAEEVRKHFGDMVFKTTIQRNVKLSEATSYGQPALVYDPDSRGAQNHIELAKELINKG